MDFAGALETDGNLGEGNRRSGKSVFGALHMGTPEKHTTKDGREALIAGKNAAGIWGRAWICHLGILLLIAGFALGQMTLKKMDTVWGFRERRRNCWRRN